MQGVPRSTEGAGSALLIDAIARKDSSLSGELILIGLICWLERFLGSPRLHGLRRCLLLLFDSVVIVCGRRIQQESLRLFLWLD